MKSRILMFALAAGALGSAVCLAQDPNMGTWKRNEAKSKMPGWPSQPGRLICRRSPRCVRPKLQREIK